ncbi:Por secretion system C-terminal sorting domain-containing protein [Chitinophaga sp. CF118]|uniref:T9SS type A sorting domain-containing protein n=1 Tax=Chitinophaga sp. CF118 TaxID=1884367 RepID=UPI0008F3260D|nr:T9SS type A sorting domain-containing protein [Chitinophaga sp. CF118]SFD54688.1 Por secretion system C-terminal sorting domain-containing protein [Chitinophaga sp. CF118]
MKKIILFVLLIFSGKVWGQTPLNSSVTVVGQLQGNTSDFGELKLGGATMDAGMFTTKDNTGYTRASQTRYPPPVSITRNDLGIGTLSSSTAYPIRGNSATDLSFYGSYSTMGGFQVRFVYFMIAPSAITVTPALPTQICASATVSLRSTNNWPIFSDGIVSTKVSWEYSIKGSSVWKEFYTTNSFFASFKPSEYITEVLTSSQIIQFRCRIKAQYPTETFYSDYSPVTGDLTVRPAAPIGDASKIVVTPACSGQQNGKVELPGTAITGGFETMRWILRPGNVSGPCDPGFVNGVSNCGDMVDWSIAIPVATGVLADNIPPGTYSLWLLNPGADAGNCLVSLPVPVVTELNALTISQNSAQTIAASCYGASNGSVGVIAAGGDGAKTGYYFTLKKSDGTIVSAEQRITGTTIVWQNLSAGLYSAVVRDNTCTDEKSLLVEVKQPDPISGTLTVAQPVCSNPGDGSIGVVATGATNYKYNLYKDAALIQQSGTTTAANYAFNGLVSGNYSVEILNADNVSCTGVMKTATLNAVTALSLQLTASDSVSCNGGNDGRLKLSASGGSGSYKYTLGTITNTNGEFTGLAAGDYSVTLKNQATGCSDAVVKTFSVYQRKPLQVSLQKTDITCNGADNGLLKSNVTGGSGSYSYTWQQFKAGSWTGNSFWFSTDTQIEGLEPGNYRVIISDAKATGCTVTSNVITLADPAPVVITGITVNEAVCLAEGASINMTASGGDGNYTYQWSLDDGNTFTAFTTGNALHTAGTYLFGVKDGKGCKVVSQDSYAITLPASPLSFTTQLSGYNGFNISCTGASNGRIEVKATGGDEGVYTYKLNNGLYQAGNIFTDLVAGNYTVSVKDGRGCELSAAVILTQPAIKINAVKQDVLCYGASTGRIVTNISGGAAPYVCLLNGALVTDVIPNLPAGDYSLHITDANGCFKDSTISIINLYPALNIQSATVSDIVCYGTQGHITLATTGGDGVYQYAITNDNWITESAYTNAANLVAGNYAVRVKDGQGCTASYADHLLITAPGSALAFTATLSDYNGYNISCAGGDNGFAQVLANGGNGSTYSGYTYALDNGDFGNASLVEHINAGDHMLTVKDGRGCTLSASYTFTQSAQAIDLRLVSQTDVICAATPAGNVTVAGSGGVGSLQYSIDNISWQPTTSFYNLIAGNYTILVKDANSCSIGLPVKINSQDPAIVIDKVTLNDIVCYDSKGTINIQVHGGAGTLISEYAFNGGAYTTFNNTTGLNAGSYTVRVKDGPGCYSTVVDAGIITTPSSPLTATITTSDFNGTQISCNGLTDGAFIISTEGGGINYQYSFNNGAYTDISSYDHLAAGTYPVKIKDNRGCVITRNAAMQQPEAVTLTVAGIVDLSCGADPTGKITLQAGGGIIPYQYELGDGEWQETPVFPSLTNGSYVVRVKDKNSCMVVDNATVKALNPAITADEDITPVNCYGEANGAVKVNVAGGDGNYIYQWNVAGVSGSNPQHLPTGNYTLKLTDGKGCMQIFSYEVPQPDLLTLATTAPAVCDGLSDGHINATVQGGISPYQYALDNGAWGISPVFENLTAGNYKLVVQDVNGCNVRKDIVIAKSNVKPEVNFLVASQKNALDTLVIKEISVPAPDNVSWIYSPEAVILGNNMIKFSQPGNYWVQMTATFGSCTYTLKKDLKISTYDPLAGPVYTLPVHVIDTVLLSPNPNNGNFGFQVKLIKKQQVVVYVYDMNGRLVDRKQYSPTLLINDTFSLGNSISGTYLLRVITENDSRDVRFIISK